MGKVQLPKRVRRREPGRRSRIEAEGRRTVRVPRPIREFQRPLSIERWIDLDQDAFIAAEDDSEGQGADSVEELDPWEEVGRQPSEEESDVEELAEAADDPPDDLIS